ncbi:MAG: ACP S-malonyltransferase, partial [Propionibacteriaceae bacterium]|nr:ACP S-malonyltransferase [Propionibacteriaceae bacterium]
MLAIVAPGQGAQTPGFLSPWLEDPALAERLAELSDVCEIDLAHYGTEADAETIRDTAIAQPLLVAAALLTGRALLGDDVTRVGAFAGHSVGELAAMALAGTISDADALVLVRERGRAMAEASAIRPTSMTAVLAGVAEEILAAIEAAGLTPANNNGAGQIVAAGTVEQLAAFAENPPRRARLVPLSVAGAFHTVHMAP